MMHRNLYGWVFPVLMILTLSACQSVTNKPIRTVDLVDIKRFMGDWYVIASIPTFLERNIFNAVESYRLEANHIETTFKFRKGGFDGPLKTLRPKGFVRPQTGNAVWDMQFVWPFKAEYRIIHLDDDYQTTIIGRSKRDYAWIMARSPAISPAHYETMLNILRAEGYDTTQVKLVPHDLQEVES